MTLHIDDPEVERLVDDACERRSKRGESGTEAVRKTFEEWRERLALQMSPRDRRAQMMRYLKREVWPVVPSTLLGGRLSKETSSQ